MTAPKIEIFTEDDFSHLLTPTQRILAAAHANEKLKELGEHFVRMSSTDETMRNCLQIDLGPAECDHKKKSLVWNGRLFTSDVCYKCNKVLLG